MTDGADKLANPPAAVLIAGPTASGKSALGLALAQELDGEIVNADSMQVYDYLRIVTARPDLAEEAQVPHHLYGHRSPHELYSTGAWVADAGRAMEDIWARGKVPIILGGTGLYFKALTEGFVDVPPIPDAIRAETRMEVDEIGPQAAHKLLMEVDPAWAAGVHVNDPQRVARGLEVYRATGRALSDWQKDPSPAFLNKPTLNLVLDPPRDWLRERIALRFDLMIRRGALEEVARFLDLGVDPTLPAMKALGVPELKAFLEDELELDEAVAQAVTKSRQYAKRQSTWFRQQMISWSRLSAQDLESQMRKIFSFID